MGLAHIWPTGADLPDVVLTSTEEERCCPGCGRRLEICDHRFHRVETFDGPVRLVIKLLRCPDRACSTAGKTFSPYAEGTIAPPRWIVDWKVFAWIGHRRFARHWNISQIRNELADEHSIRLSDDVLENYVKRYERLVAARHEDPEQLREVYADIPDVVLSIDGIQPEKGHEVLYVVRELNAGRVWFAAPLLSSTKEAIKVLFERAKAIATNLGKPTRAWVSDKQDAFVTGIAEVFPGVPHRFCKIHFVRALAKETLKTDGQAKVRMRRKVRGLRGIERDVLETLREPGEADAADPSASRPTDSPVRHQGPTVPASNAPDLALSVPPASAPGDPVAAERSAEVLDPEQVVTSAGCSAPQPAVTPATPPPWAQVVLDYCTVTRGILNDNQGTTLDPPGQRMARALEEVKASIDECLDAKKGGPQLVR